MQKIIFTFLLFALITSYSFASLDTTNVPRIVAISDSLKATLSSSQLSTLQLSYSVANSQNWSNLPTSFQPRIGIGLGTLNNAQLTLAKALIKEISGSTINEGYAEFQQLLLADDYLLANGGGNSYGAGLYYLCFNGTPSLDGLFSIKVGGHHLQIENTYNKGVMVGATPHFEAVEPLSFVSGGNTYEPINQEKNALANMFSTLSSGELATAKLNTNFSDVLMGAKNNGSYKDWIFPATKLGLKVGLLSAAQKQNVFEAIKTYVLDVDDIDATAILNQYQKELDETYISYSGNANLNSKNDYIRIDGPGVWIEFTVQGGIVLSGVHYHSIWRDHYRDYGGAGSTSGVQTSAVGSNGVTGIDNGTSSALEYYQCYPNPINQFATIKFSTNRNCKVSIYIDDIVGRRKKYLVQDKEINGDEAIITDLSELQSGVYLLSIITDGLKKNYKLIKN